MCDMSKVKRFPIAQLKAVQGFTLIELVTVVIVLGIIALAAIPRFIGPSGFAEYALQKRLIASLRNTQLKAMFDTRPNFCYKINLVVGNGADAAFGPSTAVYLAGDENASCAATIDATSPSFLRTEAGEISAEGVTLSAQDNDSAITYVQFDNLGNALTAEGTCTLGCTFTFTGESAVTVCVADQGYVYAC
jgi:MSHA pilin protein MshC